jgi:hypothetical protein
MVRGTLSLVAFCAIFASSGDARAETYTCHSLVEESAELSFSIDRDADGVESIAKLDVLVADEFGYSTSPETPLGDRARVASLSTDNSVVRFQLFTVDPQYDYPIGEVGLVTLNEGAAQVVTAGVLQLGGGGVWPIQCEIDYDE